MKTVKQCFFDTYGYDPTMVLKTLGGDPDVIFKRWQEYVDEQSKNDQDVARLMGFPPVTEESVSKSVLKQIYEEISRLFFGNLSREQALLFCNSLGMVEGKIVLCQFVPGLEYNYMTFANGWNRWNPEKPPICFNGDFMP